MRKKIWLSRHWQCPSASGKQLAFSLAVGLALSAFSAAQDIPVHRNWPGPGQLFVGACYQPIDRTPEQIDRDIAIMKHVGFNVVRMGESRGTRLSPRKASSTSRGSTR